MVPIACSIISFLSRRVSPLVPLIAFCSIPSISFLCSTSARHDANCSIKHFTCFISSLKTLSLSLNVCSKSLFDPGCEQYVGVCCSSGTGTLGQEVTGGQTDDSA